MFHRFGGKAFIYVITLLFLGVSVQNTWQFLVTILPDATPVFIGGMMIVFEGGFLGWLALLMHGTENIPRTIIAAIMLLVTGIGVGTAAYFELDGLMHKSIAVKIDPGFLANVPSIVNGVYLATGIAIVLYALASPGFAHRMRHMNDHGTPPQRIPRGEVTGSLVALPQTASAPQPQTTVTPVAQSSGWNLRLPKWLGGKEKQQAAPAQQALPSPAVPQNTGNLTSGEQELLSMFNRFLQASQQQPQTNVQAPLNLPDPEQFADDLAASVGGGSASPLPQAPSPNGAKPSK